MYTPKAYSCMHIHVGVVLDNHTNQPPTCSHDIKFQLQLLEDKSCM